MTEVPSLNRLGSEPTHKIHRELGVPGNSHAVIWLLHRLLLFVELIALALFVVGPLAGSVDDDGDGNPDIPVVVSGATLGGQVEHAAGVSQESQNVHDRVVSAPIIEMNTHDIGIGKVEFGVLDGRSVLRSSSLLRC